MCSLFYGMALSSLRIAVLIPNWRNFCPGFYICSSIYFYLFIKLFLFIIFFLPLSHLALVWHAQSLWLGCRLGMPVRCSKGHLGVTAIAAPWPPTFIGDLGTESHWQNTFSNTPFMDWNLSKSTLNCQSHQVWTCYVHFIWYFCEIIIGQEHGRA